MKTKILIPAPDDWAEGIPLSVLSSLREYHLPFFHLFWRYENNRSEFTSHISSYDCLRELKLIMPREKRKNGSTANNGGNNNKSQISGNKWVWGNCKLSDEDIASLTDSNDTLDYLATCLASLGSEGFGFTCKPVDSGKSHCCTIFRPDYPSIGTTIGVSAFGGNLRDAILTCLFKLDTYGDGDFTGFDVESSAEGTRPRFR